MAAMTLPTARLRRFARTTPGLLVRAAHPRQALLTAFVLAVAAAASGRSAREVVLVAVTVLVGQTVLGWHNDLVDAATDVRHQRVKAVPDGLEPSTLAFSLACAVLLLIPLAVTNGLMAAACYVVAVAVGVLGNFRLRLVRCGPLSWLPWAIAFGLFPAFLSYGGWGGQTEGNPPNLVLSLLAALIGIGVHVLTALWGLVADDADGWTYLPLWLGRRIGATGLLVGAIVYLGILGTVTAVVAQQSGLAA